MLGLAHQEDLGILAPVLVAKVLTFNEKKKKKDFSGVGAERWLSG